MTPAMMRAKVRSCLRSLFRRTRMEESMDAELQFHIESYAQDLMRGGLSSEEALRRARVEFGGIEMQKEECRESLGLRLWDETRGDITYAWRVLRKSPVFTVVAVTSLALGIGANTAIFTLAKEVLFRNMAVPHADRLRMFWWARGPNTKAGPAWGSFSRGRPGEMAGTPFPYALYQQMRAHNPVFDDLVAFKDLYKLTVTADGQAEPVDGMLVSGNFYQVLAPRVIAGRGINPTDDTAEAPGVVVISDAFWARRFGRSADVLGRTIQLNRVPVTIVGVNAPEFRGAKAGGAPEVFFPIHLQPQVIPNPRGPLMSANSFWWLIVEGRLKPGVTDAAAEAAMQVAFNSAFHATIPDKTEKDRPRFFLAPGSRGLDVQTDDFKLPIYVLLAVAGVVLLIACANLANLLVARAAARRREISLRLAIGAGAWRVIRQVLTEAMLLALLGGGLGLLLGYWGRNLIPRLFEDSWSPRSIEPQMDWTVFFFAVAATVLTGILCGVAPAWRSTRGDVNAGLKESGQMSTGRSKATLGKFLVVFQVSLSLLLVVGAGLFLRTLINLRTMSYGLNPERILLFALDPPKSQYSTEQRAALFQRISERVDALPGVQSGTLSGEALLANNMDDNCYEPIPKPAGLPVQEHVFVNTIGPRFFETFAIPIIAGRSVNAHDTQNAPLVAVINQRMAKEIFPGANPVGRTLTECGAAAGTPRIEIVGVSADAKYSSIRQDVPATLYLPYLQSHDEDAGAMTFELKTAASMGSIVAEVRRAVRSIDKDLPLLDVRSQTQQIDATLTQERVFATLTTTFGILALILASIGIYGIMAYTVSQRTNEIGIRMALGARAGQVLSMVLRETSLLACTGVVAGIVAAFGLTRLVASMLYGLKPNDPLTYGAAALLLLGVALTAGFMPARGAARIDPMQALRHE